MTAESIRNLDGPALTQLAWQYGLAPVGTEHLHPGAWNDGYWIVDEIGPALPWEPWHWIVQADAVFRHLRTRRWWTAAQGDAEDGFCRVSRDEMELEVCWPSSEARTEAQALLLVSVLAVASEAEEAV